MSHYRKFVKDIGLIGIAQILTNARGFILLPILTKTLGAADLGIWYQFLVTINFLIPLTSLGLSNSLIRFLPGSKDAKDIREQIWSSAFFTIGVSVIVGLSLVLLAKPLQHVLRIPTPFMVFLAFLIVIQSLSTISSGIIQAFQEAKKLSAFIILSPIADIVFVSIALAMGKGLYGAIISMVLAKLIIFSLLVFLITQKVGFQIPTFRRIKELLNFSLPTIPGATSYRIVQVGDQYMLAFFKGIASVGYYASAYSLGLILNMITLPVGMVLPALLAKFFSENNIKEVKTYLTHTLTYILLILIPATFGLSILSKQLFEMISNREFALHAWFVIPLVAGSSLFFAAQGIFVQVLYLFKKTGAVGIIWFLAALINIGTNLIFIPAFGLLGAALTTLFSFLFIFTATWFLSSKYLSFPIEWKSLFKSVVASCLMSLGILMLHPEGLLKTIIAIALGMVLYTFFLFLMKGIGKKEIEFLTKLFA